MRKKLMVTLALLAPACHRNEGKLAVVAHKVITLADVQRAVERATGRPASEVGPELTGQLFADLLEEEVILAASGNPEDRTLPEVLRSRRVRELLAQLCPPPPPPSNEQIEQELARFGPATPQERLLVRQLILNSQAQALAVRERLAKGESFLSLSQELSRAPNADSGGSLGWVEKGQLPPEFEAALANLEAGQYSVPVQSHAGWHVFFVEKRSREADPTLRRRVEESLRAEKEEKSQKQCIASLARRLEVQVNCEQAPFPCRNPFLEAP